MRSASFALALASVVVMGGSAHAYVLVAEGSLATACSENARRELGTLQALDQCTAALAEPGLDQRNEAGTFVNRGIVFFNRADYGRALADFDAAIQLEPGLAEGYINRGAALLRQSDYSGAVAAISRGLALSPEAPARAYYNRGLAHEELGQVREAYRDYRRASELAPRWEAPRTELARFQVN